MRILDRSLLSKIKLPYPKVGKRIIVIDDSVSVYPTVCLCMRIYATFSHLDTPRENVLVLYAFSLLNPKKQKKKS